MRISSEKLNKILELHKLWIESEKREEGDIYSSRANLRYTDLSNVDLSHASLSSANLSHANLTCANLRDANLRCANLRIADLRNADLRNADLSHADLTRADLRGANLHCAKLNNVYIQGVTGNNKEIKSTNADRYLITYTKNALQIGCENHGFLEWVNFTDSDIEKMDDGALAFWDKYKDFIFETVAENLAI